MSVKEDIPNFVLPSCMNQGKVDFFFLEFRFILFLILYFFPVMDTDELTIHSKANGIVACNNHNDKFNRLNLVQPKLL